MQDFEVTMKDFESTMLTAVKTFVKDVTDTGKERLSVTIDEKEEYFTLVIGRVGGARLPLDHDCEHHNARGLACIFSQLLVDEAVLMKVDLSVELTVNDKNLAEITFTRLSNESMH